MAARGDLALLAGEFHRRRRVQVPDLLAADAARGLYTQLAGRTQWARVTRIAGQHRTFDAAAMDALPPDKRAEFDGWVAAEARLGFQYLYDRYPLHDLGRAGQLDNEVIRSVYLLIRSTAFIETARAITARPDIEFADGQLTRYRPGHFLTLHDDHAEGLGRIAAYVLNLTPDWPADFGGQLQFADAGGQVAEAVAPRLNSLAVFEVPSPHLVSMVAPFASGARYALTGWFRSGSK